MFITEENYYNTLRTEVLDESAFTALITKTATILGFSTLTGLAGIGAALIAKSALSKQGKVRKFFTKIFKKSGEDINFKDYKEKASAKREIENSKDWSARLSDVYKAIEVKDWDEAKERFESSNYFNNVDAVKAIIIKVTDVLGEPPLFVYPSGNQCYFALKKVIGIKYAKASAEAVLVALRQNKSYYDDLRNQELNVEKDN